MVLKVEPNESYFIKEIHARMASCISVFMADTGGQVVWLPGAWEDDAIRRTVIQDYWRAKQSDQYPSYPMAMFLKPKGYDHHDHRKSELVAFYKPFYDPNQSKINYGPDKKVDDAEEIDDGLTKVFDNTKGVTDAHIKYTESVEMANSVSHEISQGINMDVTSETTVSGGYAGVSAEQKFSVAFGVHFDETTTKEESKATTESLEVEFTVPAGRSYLLEVKKESQRIQTPFDIDGILNCGVVLDYYDWIRHTENAKYTDYKNYFKFDTLEDFEQFFRGYDTDHPTMRGYWENAYSRVHNALNALMQAEHRRVQCTGVKDRILQKNATYTTTDITGKPYPEGDKVIHVDGDDPDELTAEARSYLPRFGGYDDPPLA